MHKEETPQQKAIRLLNRQLDELQTVRSLNAESPVFSGWYDATRTVLDRFLGPESHYTRTFGSISFINLTMVTNLWGPSPPPGSVSPEDIRVFQEGCGYADATLKAAIRHVEDFGVYEENPTPTSNNKSRGRKGGGITQTFNAPVSIHNMALAADDAIQKIGQMGDNTGASLKEIADLLQQSEDLTPREVREGLAHIEAVAVEVQKPEANRDGKTILERCEGILSLANKATDLAGKIAPYTPAIFTLMEQAKHWIR